MCWKNRSAVNTETTTKQQSDPLMFEDPDDRPRRSKERRPMLLTDHEVDQALVEQNHASEPQGDGFKGDDRRNPLIILDEKFPHVAKRILGFWGSPQLSEYMIGLTLVDRAGRAGFPEDAMTAIMEIWKHIQSPENATANNPWVTDARLTKTFKQEDLEKSRALGYRPLLSGKDAAATDLSQIRSAPQTW